MLAAGELGRVVIDAHTDPTFVAGEVIDAVRNRLAQFLVGKVMNVHLLGLALGLPFLARILEFPDQFLLFRVDRDHWLVPLLKRHHLPVDVLELSVAVRMRRAFARLAVGLQAVAGLLEQCRYLRSVTKDGSWFIFFPTNVHPEYRAMLWQLAKDAAATLTEQQKKHWNRRIHEWRGECRQDFNRETDEMYEKGIAARRGRGDDGGSRERDGNEKTWTVGPTVTWAGGEWPKRFVLLRRARDEPRPETVGLQSAKTRLQPRGMSIGPGRPDRDTPYFAEWVAAGPSRQGPYSCPSVLIEEAV